MTLTDQFQSKTHTNSRKHTRSARLSAFLLTPLLAGLIAVGSLGVCDAVAENELGTTSVSRKEATVDEQLLLVFFEQAQKTGQAEAFVKYLLQPNEGGDAHGTHSSSDSSQHSTQQSNEFEQSLQKIVESFCQELPQSSLC